jgi:hypothetical protein
MNDHVRLPQDDITVRGEKPSGIILTGNDCDFIVINRFVRIWERMCTPYRTLAPKGRESIVILGVSFKAINVNVNAVGCTR